MIDLKDDSQLIRRLGSYEYPLYEEGLRANMKRFLGYQTVVLDAGCGPRTKFFLGLPQSAWAIGLDIDRENVEEAKKTSEGNTSLIVGSLQNLPFIEEALDLIICCDVLEHVRDPHKAIGELTMSLRKGGIILITTTNVLNPAMLIDIRFSKLSKMLTKRFDSTIFHERRHRFSPWTLAKEIRKYGLMMNLNMFGDPPIGRPWLVNFQGISLPKIYYLWIVFDKLTNIKILKKFKEMMLAVIKKPR